MSEQPLMESLQRHRHFSGVFATWTGIGRLAAVNHSIVGKRFMATAFFFFILGGMLAMLIRAQLATSESAFMSHAAYNQVFTMHGTVMMFLFAIPMIEGFALYMLPKVLGARDLAYPRLSAFGYWCYLFGGTIILGGMVLGLAPDGGWFLYTPLSSREFTPGVNADIWLLGITFVENLRRGGGGRDHRHHFESARGGDDACEDAADRLVSSRHRPDDARRLPAADPRLHPA